MTVHPVTESVAVTTGSNSALSDFKKRSDTYSLTAPQSFKVKIILEAYEKLTEEDIQEGNDNHLPLLDAAMVYAKYIDDVPMVKDSGANIKITTPEDVYFLRAMFEMEENKYIFGI